MKTILRKTRIDFKGAGFLAIFVFLAVFSILYYFTSWNTRPVFEKSADNQASFAEKAENFSVVNEDSDNDGLTDDLEILHGTDPKKADTDGDGYGDKQEITNGYDPAAPGDARPRFELFISKIGVAVPIIWSKSENEKEQLADLQNGVSHFPKTAAPGQPGNMIISGHSSNYIWAKGNYNYIFKDLNNLVPGDFVIVNAIQQNGKVLNYQYQIREKFTTVANDSRIFENTENPTLTLSTCWPIGSNARRLIIKGELVGRI